MATKKKRSKKRSPTHWQDIGNEVMDGVQNVAGGLWREVTFNERSLNQRAMGKIADAAEATAGLAAIAAVPVKSAGHFAGSVYNGALDGVQAVHDHVWDNHHKRHTYR